MTPSPPILFEGQPARPALFWRRGGGRHVVCEVCPRACRLAPGQRGLCRVRAHAPGEGLVLTGDRLVSALHADPIEKKPLFHFLPGSRVLSIGQTGCNLTCRFCQNHALSLAAGPSSTAIMLDPKEVPALARASGCRSVALTYNEPVVALEYGLEVAGACRAEGIRTVAVTAGYVSGAARAAFFRDVDAANVDLKAFSDGFYRRLCSARLAPVLETLLWLRRETGIWLEITTLIIPGQNDGDDGIRALAGWIARHLGTGVPLHLSAFFPAHRMADLPRTPLATLRRARALALAEGLEHVYLGNAGDPDGETTVCARCGAPVIRRDRFRSEPLWQGAPGVCPVCGQALAGRFS
ncbi:AmmeMemoRadiSam system radical SAM enzyme [Phaeovibrio sulfidiphilus]|uniref:AmmeMemoRadiSam system radical SAM enzyme n=1 Tax=Phaeovibrio sulfidiphilus TaxID=1220600 RepID=A0A8J6YN87_9PROT|nr:AmmeMemoRadiSam system radical SAM enzyme [Phaeovibrio sulfidiphilus]MBE1237610.1 AmmeMemoRadiSam system radical SAM enzyme [Phaeovibrio sulfidiphilus]